MAILRVKPGISSAVMLPDGRSIVLQADQAFNDNDPLVSEVCKATGTKVGDWFQSDADAGSDPRKRRQSVRVESAADADLM